MTDLTDEAVKALLAHYDLPTDCDCDDDDCVKCSHYPTLQERASKQLKDAAPDLAHMYLAARADAEAAVALVVEEAAKQLAAARETFCYASPGSDEEFTSLLLGFDTAAGIIRAIAPASGVAKLAELRKRLDVADTYAHGIGDRMNAVTARAEAAEAALAAAQAAAEADYRASILAALDLAPVVALVEAGQPILDMLMFTESAGDDESVIMRAGTIRKMRAALAAFRVQP